MEKKTPLYDCHLAADAKIVEFAGFLMPIQYPAGIIAEHMAVRSQCGIFDVSHMGEVVFKGADALANINRLFTNDYTNLEIGRVRYGLMCNEEGGALDDLLVYKLAEDEYLAVVNAANIDKDVSWLEQHLFGEVQFENLSDRVAQISLQGPASEDVISLLTKTWPSKYYSFINHLDLGGIDALVSATGYTGEKGYEIYLSNDDAPQMWKMLLQAGEPFGLLPCGLGARDTLRLEASMPLYGHELNETITPLEAGLGFAVKLEKDFIGSAALMAKPQRSRIGLKALGRGIIREHQDIFFSDKLIGSTTSGTHCPYLEGAYAMALVDAGIVEPGDIVEADVRGRRIEAQVVAMPFYQRPKA